MNKKSQNDYEEAVSRLEQIIIRLEEGDLALQDTLTLFEEGIELVKECDKILNKAEGKIKILVESLGDEIIFKDFNGGF